ncbi:MAG TPA: hypothetical protein VIE13_01545 [Terriglobales bacterium]
MLLPRLSPDSWTAIGTWALALVGSAAAWAAFSTLRQIRRQTDTLVTEAQQMASQTDAISRQADLMARQWDEERALKLEFRQGTPKGILPILPPFLLEIRNFSSHAVFINGLEFLEPGGQGALWPVNMAIEPERAEALNFTKEMHNLISGQNSVQVEQAMSKLNSTCFRLRLHCTGFGGHKTAEVYFAATYTDRPTRSLTLAILPPTAEPAAGA